MVVILPLELLLWLSMMPFVSAIGAGNVVVLKPAHETPAISSMIQKIISEVLTPIMLRSFWVKAIGWLFTVGSFCMGSYLFTGSARVGSGSWKRLPKI